MRQSLLTITITFGLGLIAGCTSSSTISTDDARKMALEELGRMLKALPDDGRKPPTKLAELEPIEPMIPLAGPMIRSGDINYVWGAAYVSGGKNVIAYEKSAPSDGGYVLLEDGSVKKMTASEFQSAPKAK
jgi:hypothetical protein